MLNKQDKYTNTNLLYVNKQEFSASSWKSNQGYTKICGQLTIKICNAKQDRYTNTNVLYVNKQEFSASSWRSNQGYTKMHGQPTIKSRAVVPNWGFAKH
jgi:hypothetical protein